MKYDHLLGLPLQTALDQLHSDGITQIRVEYTSAPPRRGQPDESRTAEAELEGLCSTRVISIRDDGHVLIVSRFITGTPRI